MIDYEFKDLLLNDDIDKQILIKYDTGQLTNNEIPMDELSVEESICSEESLVFGTCEASVLKFTCNNVFEELKNKWLNVTITPKGASTTFQIGQYKVYSDIPAADRKKRNVVAYDALYDVLQADISEWYNTLLPEESSTTTLKAFRDSFFAHFGIEQEETTLINDDMAVAKTIQPEELSGKVVVNAICEINGCFGHIGRNGKFKYIYLEPISEGLYPSETLYPSENLYPADPNTNLLKTGHYISATYEDYLVEKITGLLIRQEEDDAGGPIGVVDNAYVIQGNFLVYGKSAEELKVIGENILNKIAGIYYRPFSAKAKGNPCLEVGDGISLSTKYMAIHSYILQRTLSGIQALRDEYSAEGTQYQPTEVNSTARSIQQLKGKTNKLTRTVEETRLEMMDIENGLSSEISITAAQIRSELSDVESGLESTISQTASSIRGEVEDIENDLSSKIQINTDSISAEVERAEKAEASLRIQADGIALSVEDLEADINTQIELLSDEISLRVSSDEVQSMIDISLEDIEITASQIRLEGYTTINGGFQVFNDGSVMISSSDGEYSCEMGIYGLNVYRWNSDYFSGTRNDGFFVYDYDNNVYELLWYNEDRNRIYIGLSGSDTPCYIRGDYLSIENSATINGYEVITAENISDYSTVPSTIFIDDIYGNDEYSSITINNGNFSYVYADVLDAFEINLLGQSLSDIIDDFERRISALE